MSDGRGGHPESLQFLFCNILKLMSLFFFSWTIFNLLGFLPHCSKNLISFFKKIFKIYFQKEGKGRRKREKNINVWSWLAD